MVSWSAQSQEEQRLALQARKKKRAEMMANMRIQDFRDAVQNTGPLAHTWQTEPSVLIHDLCNAVDNASVPIFAVFAEDSHNPPQLLGHATGKQEDIEAFYDDRKAYGLTLTPVEVQNIPPGFSAKRKRLLEAKVNYQREIDRINLQLQRIGG